MEYLTIQDPRTHHFREMDPYSSDAYAVRSRDAMPRPMRAPSFDHVRTPSPNSHRSPNGANPSNDWQRWPQSHGPPSISSTSRQPPQFSNSAPLHATYARAEPISASTSSNGASTYSPMKHSPPGWTHPVQPIPVRPSAQTVQVLQANEEQKSCKLPSFNSLVEQLERNPEPKSASTALSVATEVAWKRQEPGASFVPLEPPTFQFANHNSTGRSGASRAVTHSLASSEPTSPHALSRNPFSPRLRAQSPRYRGHSRRASDYRSRALSHLPTLSGRDAHVSPYPTTHHRTQTFPSFPQQAAPEPPLNRGADPFQPQLPPQHLSLAPPHPNHTSLPALHTQQTSHSRNDSVLTPADDYRFHSGTFYATGSSNSHYQRKRRGNLPKDATKILRQWFDDHLQAPYPGEEVKNELCARTGLQMSQVNNWFINARRRLPRVETNRNRRERESTDVSDGSPTRDRQPQHPSTYT